MFVITAHRGDVLETGSADGVTVHRIRSPGIENGQFSVWEMISFVIAALFQTPDLARRWRPDAAIIFFGLPN